MSRKIKLMLLLVLTVCTTIFTGIRAVHFTGGMDGRSSYYGSRLLLTGKNPYSNYNIVQAWVAQGSPPGYRPGLPDAPFLVTPSAAILFAPVMLFSSPTSGITFIRALSFLCGLSCIFFLTQMRKSSWSKEICLLFALYVLLLPPFLRSIAYAQSTLIVSACLAAFLYALSRKNSFVAGMLLGLSLAKFTLTFPFLAILIYRRDWKTSLVAILSFVMYNLTLLVSPGIKQCLGDYRTTLMVTQLPGTGAISVYDMTLINLKHILFLTFKGHPTLAGHITVIATVGIIFLMAYLYKPKYLFEFKQWLNPDSEEPFSHPLAVPVAMMAALVLIYHRYYDLASLIFVAWGLIDYGIRWPERRSLLWKLSIFLLVMASYFGSSNLPFRLLDPYLNRFGMATLFYLNCYFTLFLFLGLLGLFCVDRYTYRNKNTAGDFLNTEFPAAAHITSNHCKIDEL